MNRGFVAEFTLNAVEGLLAMTLALPRLTNLLGRRARLLVGHAFGAWVRLGG